MTRRVLKWGWHLGTLLVLVGVVLSPLRAMAATIPTLMAYDAAVRPTATMPGTLVIERREAERPAINDYDSAQIGYGDPLKLPVARGAAAVHAYDSALKITERCEPSEGVIYDAPAATAAAESVDAFAAHAAMRADLGLATGEGTLAKLEVGGQEFWGINAHGQPVAPLSVNAISATHAEADAFAQAARAGVNGGTGRLIVDRALCPACGTFGAVRSMARQLGLSSLEVVTPAGTSTIIP